MYWTGHDRARGQVRPPTETHLDGLAVRAVGLAKVQGRQRGFVDLDSATQRQHQGRAAVPTGITPAALILAVERRDLHA